MNMRSALLASLATASLLSSFGNASASPYTAYVEGTSSFFIDWTTAFEVPENEGQLFSARITFDIANAGLDISSPDPSHTYRIAGTERGCDQIVNGGCTLDYGAQLPVITGYTINAPFAPLGGYQRIPTSRNFLDLSVRGNHSAPGWDVYDLESSQEQCNTTGDLDSAYTQDCVNVSLHIQIVTDVNTMFGSLSNVQDLNRTPNLSDVPPGQVNVFYIAYETINDCTKEVDQDPICVQRAYPPGSLQWWGPLASLVVLQDSPTSKDQCKNGGWKSFGFKNQGQCVSFVNHI